MLDAGGMETPSKPPWWRYLRLSVRGLMLVVLAVGGCLGWWMHLAHVQRQAVAAIRAAGGSISYEWYVPGDPSKPGWRRWVAEHVDVDLTSNVVYARLSPRCGEAELAQVAKFDHLEHLYADGANVTDASMPSLGRLTRLRFLDLENCPITDSALVHLEALTRLEFLSLERTPVTDAGLVHLKGLTNLRVLQLAGAQVADAGLASLERLASLEDLTLARTKVGDAGLAHLTRLPRLQNLRLDRTWITDAGLVHLGGITSLKVLNLSCTQVTAVGKSQILKALPNLIIDISSPDGTDTAAKAEKPPEAGGDRGGGSKGRIFTPDSKLMYVNVYSTAPDADQKDLVNFANAVVMPRLRRIKGMDIPRNLARRIKGIDVLRNFANRHSAVRIRLNRDRMRAHNLSSNDIIKALTPSTIAGSQLDRATKTWQSNEYELIHTSLYNKPEQWEKVILKASPDGEVLRLKDVGRVDMAPPFFDISTDVDGHPATMIVLKPLPGWSAAIAIEAIEKDLEELKAAAFAPGMNFEVIPLDSPDMIYAVIEAPRGSTLEFTSARCHELGAIARGIDGITSVSSLAGYELRTEDRDSTAGTCLIHLKDRSDRKLTSRQIIEVLEGKCRTMNVDLEFFEPPAVSVFGAAGGFSVRVLDRAISHSDGRPGSGPETFMDDLLKRKTLEGLITFLAGHYPEYELVIDNDAAMQKGVSIADAMENLPVFVNGDVQSERTSWRLEVLSDLFVKNDRGEMVPYSSFLQLKLKEGLTEIDR
jgi:hypothetical protein